MGDGRGVYRVLVGKPVGNRPLGGLRRTWEDNIKMDFQKWDMGYGLDEAGSRQGQVRTRVNAVMNLRVS